MSRSGLGSGGGRVHSTTTMVVVVECTAVIEIASRFSTTRYLRVFVRVDAYRSRVTKRVTGVTDAWRAVT